jgi:hypothetical protein
MNLGELPTLHVTCAARDSVTITESMQGAGVPSLVSSQDLMRIWTVKNMVIIHLCAYTV